ncbi:MAG: ribosome-associated translation inhibitor RaiA [Planctomycetes bacterium]|nr:ribosome-associated translation inhibitor RaiA [Planctomycetota bacterium]
MTEETEVTIEFKGRHDDITERMQAHAANKLARLARFRDRLSRIEVVAEHAHRNPEIELIVHRRRGLPLVARDRGTSFSSTIDLLVDKMEKQLRKEKERRKDHKHPDAKAERAGGRPARARGRAEAGDEESYESIVDKTLRR